MSTTECPDDTTGRAAEARQGRRICGLCNRFIRTVLDFVRADGDRVDALPPFSLGEARLACEWLRAGRVNGRAVALSNGRSLPPGRASPVRSPGVRYARQTHRRDEFRRRFPDQAGCARASRRQQGPRGGSAHEHRADPRPSARRVWVPRHGPPPAHTSMPVSSGRAGRAAGTRPSSSRSPRLETISSAARAATRAWASSGRP